MTVGMEQLHVVDRVRTASAAPNSMMVLTIFLCRSQWLTTNPTSSPLFLPKILDPTAACQRLGQLPTPPCLQVQFPLLIVGIDVAPDLHITNDPDLGRGHQLDRPALAFLVPQRTGEDPVAMTLGPEVGRPDPSPALVRVPAPAPPPHHLEDPAIHGRKGALARRITVIHGPALDLLVQAPDHLSGRQAARVVDCLLDLG